MQMVAEVEVGKAYRIVPESSAQKSLFVSNASLDAGAAVVIWTETDVPAQQWFVEALPELPEEEVADVQKVPPAVLQGFIKALPDGYRTVFNLVVFEQKSHKEVASLLGIKEDSSASQFFRARASLARQINQYLKEYE